MKNKNFKRNTVNPVAINFRNIYNNKIFCIKYRIRHFCTGKCKFSNQSIEEISENPYIDIPLIFYTDENKCKFANEVFNLYIFININTICKEIQCYNENDYNNINFYAKKYEILELPPILSINININDYSSLLKYNKRTVEIFTNNITIYDFEYKLIGFITLPNETHFFALFENYDDIYSSNLNQWFKFDDLVGYNVKINNIHFSLYNIYSTVALVLSIY